MRGAKFCVSVLAGFLPTHTPPPLIGEVGCRILLLSGVQAGQAPRSPGHQSPPFKIRSRRRTFVSISPPLRGIQDCPGVGFQTHSAVFAAIDCRGRGGAGQPCPFRSLRQGAAPRRAHERTIAAGAGAGQPRLASAATTIRTFAVGPTTIALRLPRTLKYTGMGSMEP
jgi:hypothetical protein